jgi:glycosyltransferase involved in cell wall biosynthesis
MTHPAQDRPIRVLYTFGLKIGAGGVCYAAWQHVNSLHHAGAKMTVFPGVLHKPLPTGVHVCPTLSKAGLRIPYKLLGRMWSAKLHDQIVAKRLRKMKGEIDLVHGFAMGSLETFKVAKELGIPTVLERCNAHTRFAYEIVDKEAKKLGLQMPDGHPHAFNDEYLKREEIEYDAADYIFCPSEFVANTFIEKGFKSEKIERFRYGYDEDSCYSIKKDSAEENGLKVIFAAACAPRKGLHYALEAWLKSSACHKGKFQIVGEFIPGYAEKLSQYLDHPSVSLLGYRKDLSALMRASDVMVLASIEEGSALVTYDARGSGCVLLVSDSTGAVCEHEKNALIHRTGDVDALASHFSRVSEDRSFLKKLRTASLETATQLTWPAAGRDMLNAYHRMVNLYQKS